LCMFPRICSTVDSKSQDFILFFALSVCWEIFVIYISI
jgi:hypothetical protein